MTTYFTLQLFTVSKMTFLHVTAMTVNMLFNKEDGILIKNLYLLTEYTAQSYLKKFQVRVGISEIFGRY